MGSSLHSKSPTPGATPSSSSRSINRKRRKDKAIYHVRFSTNFDYHEKITLLIALATTAFAAGKPNVLFIAIDDLRPELGCYGSPSAKTPHIDRFAAQGMRFDLAYCQVPVCGASRASLMTGILPTPKRFINAATRTDKDAPGAATLPQVFKAAGYTAVSNGKIFNHPDDTGERSLSQAAWQP